MIQIRLRHMLDASREAVAFAQGRMRADLRIDRRLALALVKEIEIIGEAASAVSDSTRAELTDIQWQQIIAMRNRLIHAYYDVNLDLVWQTIQQDLPSLIMSLERALQPYGDT